MVIWDCWSHLYHIMSNVITECMSAHYIMIIATITKPSVTALLHNGSSPPLYFHKRNRSNVYDPQKSELFKGGSLDQDRDQSAWSEVTGLIPWPISVARSCPIWRRAWVASHQGSGDHTPELHAWRRGRDANVICRDKACVLSPTSSVSVSHCGKQTEGSWERVWMCG